jgi:hypothetical protein
VHRSTTLRADELVPGRSPRRVCAERALIELAAGKLRSDDACAVLAAGVQQDLVTAQALLERVKANRHLRHRKELLNALADIAGGSESHAELLAIRLIRRAALPEPRRQASVVVEGVPKVVDLYWDDFQAGAEILGGFHREVAQWWKDVRRNAEIQTAGTMLIELPAVALRREPDAAMDLLRRFLVSRGWRPEPETLPEDGLKMVLESPRKSILRGAMPRGRAGRQAQSWPSSAASACSRVPPYAPVERYFQPPSQTTITMSARSPAAWARPAWAIAACRIAPVEMPAKMPSSSTS